MQYDAQRQQVQRLEQVMTTVFTCRSVVRYNLSLDGEQKEEVLKDIDASLEVLRACVLANITVQPRLTTLQPSQIDNVTAAHDADETANLNTNAHATLQELYRMYYTYLDMNKQTSLHSFVVRFNEVISVLDNVQLLFEQNCQAYDTRSLSVQTDTLALTTVVENQLQKVKVFVSDLYYVFMDFIRTLSSILQQNDVQLNTEKLSPSSERRSEKIRSVQLQKIHEPGKSLQTVQETYQLLRRRQVRVEPQISEAAAFLEFLKETLRAINTKKYKMGEILIQTDTVSRLLSELVHIIADYEKITTTLLSMR